MRVGRIARGWTLARRSLDVVVADGSLSALVVLGSVLGILAVGLVLLPGVAYVDEGDQGTVFALVVLASVVGSIVATFFAVALAAAAADVLDGRDATVGRSLGVAWSRRGAVIGWALVLVSVNLVLQAFARRLGPLGAIAAGIAGAAWELVTFLVVPVIALEGIDPLKAVRRSGTIFRDRWGEQVVGQVSIAGVFFLVGFLPAAALFALAFLGPGDAIGPFEVVCVGAGIVILVVASILGQAARGVFSVALLRYATRNGELGPFDPAELESAIGPR
jgi:hypothetical protein